MNTYNETAMADRFKATDADPSAHAMNQLYRSITMLKIYYDYQELVRKGYNPNDLNKNADAVQELLVTVSVFAEKLDEDNQIRLAWERCIRKAVDVYDETEVLP